MPGSSLAIPIIASAMDAVVDVRLAGELARLGGLAILNLEGVQARYDDPDAVLARIAAAPDDVGPCSSWPRPTPRRSGTT